MVKLSTFKLHKFAGLVAGGVLFVLAISGFVLDHDYWRVFYSLRFSTDTQELQHKEQRLITSKIVTQDGVYVGSMRGVYEKKNENFLEVLSLPTMAIVENNNTLFAATTEGVYIRSKNGWKPFALKGEVVTSLSATIKGLVAVVQKSEIVVLDFDAKIVQRTAVSIPQQQLASNITLSRFLRDLHYGRGLFDDGVSLLLNDYAAFVLAYLALSGYIIWLLIRQKRFARATRFLIKTHANSLVIFSTVIMLILGVSGIYLDHASFLNKYTKNVSIANAALPPVYKTLKEDIWSVASFENSYYIGNRLGVYRSDDLVEWKRVSKGFGYSLSSVGGKLYIGGMGASNRVCDKDGCKMLPNTPHMFKQVYVENEQLHYLSTHHLEESMPSFNDISLYTLMLSLHDGSFFASWWIWVNDIAVVLLCVLIVTGSMRWWKKKRK